MDYKQYFKEQESKLRLEALIKSALAGVAVGGALGFIVALIGWFTDIPGLWLDITVTVVTGLIAGAIFYFKVFKPTVMSSARRLDRLGLDERLITMVELEGDDSYMAQIQRQDATEHLTTIKKTDIRIIIPIIPIIFASISFPLVTGMTTVTALSDAGIIMSGNEFIDSITPDEPEINISVTYEAEEGGTIDGEAEQLVIKGQDATPVLAVADDGYIFIEWSDGKTDPYRHDPEILEELELFAIFEWDEDAEEEEEDNVGEDEGDGEAPTEEQGKKEGDKDGEEAEDGDPSEEQGSSDQGKYGEANQIIDGETYYREILSEYQDRLLEYLEANRDKLSEEEIEIIESYLGIV